MTKSLLILLWLPQFVFSAINPTVEILGKIIKYDKTTVTIAQEDKKGKSTIIVPKKTIPKHLKIQTNQCVYAVLDYKNFAKYIKILQQKVKIQKSKLKKLQKNFDH